MAPNPDPFLAACSSEGSLLGSVIDRTPFVLWSLDEAGVIRSIRGGGLKLLNLEADQMVGHSVFDLYADNPELLVALEDSLQGKEFHAVIHLFGSQLTSWFRPVNNEENKTVGVIGISLIGTGLVETRNAESEEGHCFEILKRLANVGIFSCDKSGEIQFANDYFWSCFSVIEARDEEKSTINEKGKVTLTRQGVYWGELFQDENDQLLKDSFQGFESGQTFQQELKPVFRAAPIEWVQVQIDHIGGEEWVGTVLDVTAVKQAENMFGLQKVELEKAVQLRTLELVERNSQLSLEVEKRKEIADELQLSRDYMEAIIRNAVDLILHIDREGRVLFMNRTITGYDIKKVIGRSLYDWISPSHREAVSKVVQQVYDHQEHVSLDIPAILATGEHALYSTRWGPIYNEGKIIGVTVVARNITHERKLEEEAKQRHDELSHLTRLGVLGEIAATISHELKQPLLAIGNYATGCLHRFNDGTISEETVIEAFNDIAELSLRARKIVHRTRDFATKKPITPVAVNPHQLLEKSVELVHSEIIRNNIQLKNELSPAVPVIYIDLLQGQQVLVNLLLNAIEAISSSEKEIQHTITIQSVILDDDFSQLTITDTADGIKKESLENLFDMYHTSKESGLGMGLAISQKIMERHGGKLELLNTGSQGTTFKMIVPVSDVMPCQILTPLPPSR